jgi:hypothetical protein
LRLRRSDDAELGGGNGQGGGAEEMTALMVDLFGRVDLGHGKSPCFGASSDLRGDGYFAQSRGKCPLAVVMRR